MADYSTPDTGGVIAGIGQAMAPPIPKRDIKSALTQYGLQGKSVKGMNDQALYNLASQTVISQYKSRKAQAAKAASQNKKTPNNSAAGSKPGNIVGSKKPSSKSNTTTSKASPTGRSAKPKAAPIPKPKPAAPKKKRSGTSVITSPKLGMGGLL